jgi:hypothetical protein
MQRGALAEGAHDRLAGRKNDGSGR